MPPPIPGTDAPNIPIEYYNLMNATWPDGLHLTSGGTGYNPGSTDSISYAFSSAPNEPGAWSMCEQNLPGEDRRVVIGSGPLVMNPGSINSFSFAVVYADNIEYPCPNIDPLINAANEVADFYNGTLVSTAELEGQESIVHLTPTPMHTTAILSLQTEQDAIQEVRLFNLAGQQIRTYPSVTTNQLTIERGNLPAGLYLYHVRTRNDQIYSGKFLIQ